MATSLTIQESIPNKLRGFIVDKSSGHPLGGVVVEAIAQPIEDSDYIISLGLLVSDHAGYVSFDLRSIINIQSLEHLWICPIGDDAAKIDLVTHFSSTANNQTTGNRPAFYHSQFTLKTDGSLVCNCNGSINLLSIQNPDIEDWDLSPYSFAAKNNLILGEAGCEVPVPSTDVEREYRFSQVVRTAVPISARTDLLGTAVGELEPGLRSLLIAPVEANKIQVLPTAMPIMHGEVLEFKQTWIPRSHSLGAIIYSLALAPCESVNIAIIDWSRRDEATRKDTVVSKENLYHEQRRDRTLGEKIASALKESQGGWSLMGGVSATIPVEGVPVNLAVGGGTTNSWGNRDLTGNSKQDLHDTIIQATNVTRSLDSTVVVQATQDESNYLETRTITNHNHCHALTIQYYEVLRHFKVVTEYVGRRQVVLLPFQVMVFPWQSALHHRTVLEAVLLDPKLLDCFDALVRLHKIESFYDQPKVETDDDSDNGSKPTADASQINWYQLTLEMTDHWGGKAEGAIQVLLGLQDNTWKTLYNKKTKDKRPDHPDKDEGGGGELLGLSFTTEVTTGDVIGLDPAKIQQVRVRWFENGGGDFFDFKAITIRCRLKDQGDLHTLFHKEGESVPPKSGSGKVAIQFFDDSWGKWQEWTETIEPASWITIPKSENPKTGSKEVSSKNEPTYSREKDDACEQLLVTHLNANLGYYNRAIWLMQDTTDRVMMLNAALAGHPDILNNLDTTPIAVSGNYVAFPYNAEPTKQEEEKRKKRLEENPPSKSIVSLPTRGVFAEAHLSHCNACEVRDVTRFWKWEESPCEKPPTIERITPGPKGQAPTIQPTTLPSPVVQIMQAPAAPDPVGLAAALNLMGQPNIFRDMSGTKEVQQLLSGLASGAVELAKAQHQQTPEERYDNLQVAKEVAKAAPELGWDEKTTEDVTNNIIGGGRPLLASADAGFVPDGGATSDAGVKPNYWSRQDKPRVVVIGTLDKKTHKIEEYDFDFNPTGKGDNGEVDGPNTYFFGDHNGAYKIVRNEPGNFAIKVNIGTDSLHRNDLNISLEILNGKATLNGTFKEGTPDENKADGKPVSVTGAGTKSNPFKIKFAQGSLEWGPLK